MRADLLRLNTAVPATPAGSPGYSPLGLLGGDQGGFPNGRRVADDVVTVGLRAIAGQTYPLIAPAYEADPAVATLTGRAGPPVPPEVAGTFPYLGPPHSGYRHPG